MKKLILFTLILISFLFSVNANATSGSCSSHNGVNCSIGPDTDGSVICNDGWDDSSVNFYSASECQNEFSCTNENDLSNLQGTLGQNMGMNISSNSQILINQCKKDIDRYNSYINTIDNTKSYDYNNINSYSDKMCVMIDYGFFAKLGTSDTNFYYDNQCKYKSYDELDYYVGDLFKQNCEWTVNDIDWKNIRAHSFYFIKLYENNISDEDAMNSVINHIKETCPEKQCVLNDEGYYTKNNKEYYDNKCIVNYNYLIKNKLKKINKTLCNNDISNDALVSIIIQSDYYNWNDTIIENELKRNCTSLIIEETILEEDKTSTDESTKLNITVNNIDQSLTNRLKGKLLLQTQQSGRIWYVNPDNGKKFEVTFANALPLFENFALGISNNDLDKIPLHSNNWTSATGNRLKGKLLLQVEQNGRIWYVDFDGKRWEVTWANLMTLFESLALGITDDDLNQIDTGEL